VKHQSVLQSDGTYITSSYIQLTPTRWDNRAEIRCCATNEVLEFNSQGVQESVEILNVTFAPVLHPITKSITANSSDQVNIQYKYEANPTQIVAAEWRLNGSRLATDTTDYTVNINADTISLNIRNISVTGPGEYSCVARNNVGQGASASISMVTLLTPPHVTILMSPMSPVIEDTKTNVTLFCNIISGHPSQLITVRWFMNGHLLNELPQCTSSRGDEDLCDVDPSKLVLESVNRHFYGNFSCIGISLAGRSHMSNSLLLEVLYPPGPARLSLSPNTQIFKGMPVTLSCLVSDPGKPAVSQYIWYKNGVKLKSHTNQTWTIQGSSLLSIANYSCQGVNTAGSGLHGTSEVNVSARPRFIHSLSSYTGYLAYSNSVHLMCQVECRPLCHIGWYNNGSYILSKNTLYSIHTEVIPSNPDTNTFESVRSTLIFNIIKWPTASLSHLTDNSEYSCQSTSTCDVTDSEKYSDDVSNYEPRVNEHVDCQGVKSSTNFRVEYSPRNISVSNRQLTVVEHGSGSDNPIHILCSAEGFPEPSYSWRYQGQKLVTEGPILELNNVTRNQAGTYLCQAENKHGVITDKTQVEVLYLPTCEIFVKEKLETFLIKCMAHGNPRNFTFSWKKNKHPFGNISQDLSKEESTLDLQKDQTGTFECIVSNKVGTSKPCHFHVDFQNLGVALGSQLNETAVLATSCCVVVLLLVAAAAVVTCWSRSADIKKRLNQSDLRQRQGGRGGGTGPDLSTAGVYRQHGDLANQRLYRPV